MHTSSGFLTSAGRPIAALVRFAVAIGLAVLFASGTSEAQGSVSAYLPLVSSNLPGGIDYPDWTSPFGVVMYGGISDTGGLERMQEAGASWVITTLHWSTVEASEGTRTWSAYDGQFLTAKRAGMDVSVLVTGVPNWAFGTCTNSGGCPGMRMDAFARFLAAAAERYDGDGNLDAPGSPTIKYWTLFAEPDYCGQLLDGKCTTRVGYNEDFKGLWGRNGAAYVSVLVAARGAIKSAAPNALVMNGGVAFDWFVQEQYAGGPGIYDRQFMADVIAAGARPQMDMLAVHYYPITMADWTQKLNELFGSGGATVESQMRSLPVISPEMGYWSAGPGTDEATQARRLVQMFVRGLANNVQRLAWFTIFDGSPEHPTEAHGLFRQASLGLSYSNAKPSYWAYRTMTKRLAGFSYQSHHYTESGAVPSLWDHEAYEFGRQADGARLVVAWANAGSANPDGISDLVIPGASVTLTSHLGLGAANPNVLSLVPVQDGGPGDADGLANGQVTVRIDVNPVYILLP